jgi:hypothetical protein
VVRAKAHRNHWASRAAKPLPFIASRSTPETSARTSARPGIFSEPCYYGGGRDILVGPSRATELRVTAHRNHRVIPLGIARANTYICSREQKRGSRKGFRDASKIRSREHFPARVSIYGSRELSAFFYL